MTKMYSFDEIALIPKAISTINSRSECNPYTNDDKLPIFISPMTCLIDDSNFEALVKSKVIPIFPVTFKKHKVYTNEWQAITLNDFKQCIIDNCFKPESKILIDCANGHMKALFDSVKEAKSLCPEMKVMIGNIANPDTYRDCCYAGVDYVRIGIGGGSGCTTSVLTGMHSTIPWMLENIKKIKEEELKSANPVKFTKIIADGGINRIDKAIKALALGADYVMIGKLFSECTDSCTKYYYGQSSTLGQIDRFGYVKSEPEGVIVETTQGTTLDEFCHKFTAALQSAMSYAGATTLDDFIGNVDYNIQSINEFKIYDK